MVVVLGSVAEGWRTEAWLAKRSGDHLSDRGRRQKVLVLTTPVAVIIYDSFEVVHRPM